MTPLQKAKKKEKESLQKKEKERVRNYCIDQRVCPDCGGDLVIEEKGYDWELVCISCPPVLVEHKYLFGLFYTYRYKRAVKQYIY